MNIKKAIYPNVPESPAAIDFNYIADHARNSAEVKDWFLNFYANREKNSGKRGSSTFIKMRKDYIEHFWKDVVVKKQSPKPKTQMDKLFEELNK